MITLKIIMRANAASCILFGLLFLMMPSYIITFLSTENQMPEIALLVLGIGLIVNGGHLIWESLKEMPTKSQVLYFSIGDFIWVIASMILIFLEIWITSPAAIVLTVLISAVVGLFGVLQIQKTKTHQLI